MTLIFMGTPEFAMPALRTLIEQHYAIRAVVTQPDRPKDRGQKIVASPVKLLAEHNQIPVLQPQKVRSQETLEILRKLAPDVIVVAAYGQILPEALLQIPRLGCVNVHASLLPKYRGAAPINWAIMRGEQKTGITTMLMDKGMDTGDILLQAPILIEQDDTAGTLHDKLSLLGAELLLQTLQCLEQGTITPIPQNHNEATYAPLLKKEDGLINWQAPAEQIYNHVRGLFPWPGAYTYFHGKMVKLLKTAVEDHPLDVNPSSPGTVVKIDHTIGPLIATGEGYLRILEVQPESKKPIRCSDFCRGYRLAVGDRLGKEKP